ncbi:MAG: hypothetical protein GF330_01710 [Candidatus Eisenbacteria bacterium]|nr:hypothetical protein [Candidatus Eisenbacteria bacterium]
MVNWFPLIEDAHHRKGLLYDASRDYEIKPVGRAMQMLVGSTLPSGIAATSDQPEVELLATTDPQAAALSLLVVNKGPREIEATFDLALPPELEGRLALSVSRLAEGFPTPQTEQVGSFSGLVFDIQYRLQPESNYQSTSRAIRPAAASRAGHCRTLRSPGCHVGRAWCGGRGRSCGGRSRAR